MRDDKVRGYQSAFSGNGLVQNSLKLGTAFARCVSGDPRADGRNPGTWG
jgi:hypothetical protein